MPSSSVSQPVFPLIWLATGDISCLYDTAGVGFYLGQSLMCLAQHLASRGKARTDFFVAVIAAQPYQC